MAANATDQRPLFDNWRKSQNLAASSVREKSCKELTGVNVLQLNFAPCLQSILACRVSWLAEYLAIHVEKELAGDRTEVPAR